MYKLIVTDMDGTLLDSQSQLPSDFEEVLIQCQENNIHFAVASGRAMFNIKDKVGNLSKYLSFISDNGALVWTDNQYIFEDFLNKDQISRILEVGEQFTDSSVMVITESGGYAMIKDPVHREYLKEYYNDFEEIDDLLSLDKPVVKVTYIHLNKTFDNYPSFNEALKDDCSVFISGEIWVDIMNKNIDKGQGLHGLSQYHHIEAQDILAFGDFFNDVSMLDYSGHSVVVSNGHPDVKKLADEVIDSNDTAAVTKYIKNLLKK